MRKKVSEKVVKPLKKLVETVKKDKKTGVETPVTELKVVDSDGTVVKVYRKSEYGPRFVFKATQFAANNSTAEDPLEVI